MNNCYGRVAQRSELSSHKAKVVGSNPAASTNKKERKGINGKNIITSCRNYVLAQCVWQYVAKNICCRSCRGAYPRQTLWNHIQIQTRRFRPMAKNNTNPCRIFKRGQIWHAYIAFSAGGRRYVIRETTGCTDENDARTWCAQRIAAIVNDPVVTHEITLDMAAEKWWLERGQYQDTRGMTSRLKNLVLEMGPNILLSQISKNDVMGFIASCRTRGRAPATINRYLAMLSALCTRARNYWDCRTPTFKILSFRLKEPRENIKFFRNMDQVQAIIDNAAPHIRPVILTALYTGLRYGRLMSLKWEQIDWDNHQIIYIDKDGKPDSVPMVSALRSVLESLPQVNEFVFTYRGHRLRDCRTGYILACKRAGVPYLSFHALRHTTATWLLRSTGNMRLVQRVMGHANISTTTKYAHLTQGLSYSAMEMLFNKDGRDE